MTVVFFEGLNATGKSFAAMVLSRRLEVPIIRPFRDGAAQHLGCNDEGFQAELHRLGIPGNTFVDDAYTSDFLVATGLSAILDRSMGSGIAYGRLYGQIRDVDHAEEVVSLWLKMLDPYPGVRLYVQLTSCARVRARRVLDDGGHFAPDRAQEAILEHWFRRVYEAVDFNKMTIDTSGFPDKMIGPIVADLVSDELKRLSCESQVEIGTRGHN